MKNSYLAIIAIFTLVLHAPLAEANTLDDIHNFVDSYYYGEIPENLYALSSIKEIIHALDDYSQYFTEEEYQSYLSTFSSDQSKSTAATVSILNTRTAITSSMLSGSIGYLQISRFEADLDSKVESQWLALQEVGATKLIIDLRYNGGGYVDSAEQLLGFFPGVTNAYQFTTRNSSKLIKPVASHIKFPEQTYVLVNQYSASASEIVAASLIDNQVATIVGETTKGKGTIQSIFPLKDGGALKLTIGEFTGPKGTKVHKRGVSPTIETEQNKELLTIYHQLVQLENKKSSYAATIIN